MMKTKKEVQNPMSKKSDHEISNNFGTESDCAMAVRTTVRYGECQKNHAASLGGYTVDGCREFMASGNEGTNLALSCAACGCHRNFHRRIEETELVREDGSPTGEAAEWTRN